MPESAESPEGRGDDDRQAAAAVIDEVQGDRRAGEPPSLAAGEEREELAVDRDDRGQARDSDRSRDGGDAARGDAAAQAAKTRVNPVSATHAFCVALTFRSVSTIPVRWINSIQGTPRRKMSVRTISTRVHRFMWVARTSRARTIRWPAG